MPLAASEARDAGEMPIFIPVAGNCDCQSKNQVFLTRTPMYCSPWDVSKIPSGSMTLLPRSTANGRTSTANGGSRHSKATWRSSKSPSRWSGKLSSAAMKRTITNGLDMPIELTAPLGCQPDPVSLFHCSSTCASENSKLVPTTPL